ncbi:NAD(P)/FAD-dependent oxidoreductase [Tunturiibacter empetritectus]|uniref:NAD(P)/FAD-dependent oxidoreductase n=1 Tax=Tunturiibacter empetritectus TaxID=3069691 RepID=UPI0015C7B5F6
MSRKTRILILGGGFAGVEVARVLERLLETREAEIRLVSRDNFLLFTPLLHEVAASDLDITTIVNPIRKMVRRTEFIAADVNSINLIEQTVTIAHGVDRHIHILGYDHVVLALGSVSHFRGITGLEQNAMTMKTLEDAITLRNRMIAHLEEADPDCSEITRDATLTMVVAGGGFAGVETVSGIYDFMESAVQTYPNLSPSMLRVMLIHGGSHLLPELGPELGNFTGDKLVARGIEVLLNRKLIASTPNDVTLDDGRVIATKFVVWTGGNTAPAQLAQLRTESEDARVLTTRTMLVEGHPNVWALGDCARIPDSNGRYYPPTAQHALRQARVLAENLAASLHGQTTRELSFNTIGQMASIGRRSGVAQILGYRFSGFTAWFLWRTVYLTKLPRWGKRIHVALNWFLDLFFSKDSVQFMSFRAPGQGIPEKGSSDTLESRASASNSQGV